MTKKSLVIAKWEFKEKIKRKSFLFYALIFPLIIIGLSMLPSLFSNEIAKSHKVFPIGILDQTGKLKSHIEQNLNDKSYARREIDFLIINLHCPDLNSKECVEFANAEMFRGLFDAYILIESLDQILVVSQYRINDDLKNDISEAVYSAKISQLNTLSPLSTDVTEFQFRFKSLLNSELSETDSLMQFLQSFVILLLLVIITLFTGGVFVRGFVEEKSNGLFERIISSATYTDLFLGKLFGLIAVGVFQITLWSLIGILINRSISLSIFAVNNPMLQLAFFILGYLLIGTLFLASSIFISTEHDAQQITSILSIVMIIPLLLSVQLMQSPESTISTVLTYIPLCTAPVMLLKLSIGIVNPFEIIITLILLIISITLVITFSNKLFAVHYSRQWFNRFRK